MLLPAHMTIAEALNKGPEEAEELVLLKQTNQRLMKQLAQSKNKHADYVAAVYQAASDAASNLVIPPVSKPKRDPRRRQEEVAVPLVSDLQLAKVTPDYDSDVCEQRMNLYADKIIRLAEIQRSDHPVRKAYIPVLGDAIEGIEIFPGQQWLVDAGLYRQIMVDGPRIFLTFFRKLLTAFDEIEVMWIIGNHGRIGRKGTFDPETNGDRMLGKLIQMLLVDEPRIKFTVPDGRGERNWYGVAQIGNYSALCIHGDQIRGSLGLPFYGLQKKVNSWAAGAIPEPFQDVFMGHYHQIASIPLNQRDVYVNGSTESYNTYAAEQLAAMSSPTQWCLFVDPNVGQVTASYKVRLA